MQYLSKAKVKKMMDGIVIKMLNNSRIPLKFSYILPFLARLYGQGYKFYESQYNELVLKVYLRKTLLPFYIEQKGLYTYLSFGIGDDITQVRVPVMWRTYKYYDYDKNPEVDVFDITKVNNFLRKYKLFAIQSRKLTRFDREGIPLLNRVFYLKKPLNIGLVDAYDVPDRWKVKYADGSDLVIKANTKIKFLKIGKVSYTVHIDGQTLEIPESVFDNKFIEVLK